MAVQSDISKLQGFIVNARSIKWYNHTRSDVEILEEMRKERERKSRKVYKASGYMYISVHPKPLTPREFGQKIMSKHKKK